MTIGFMAVNLYAVVFEPETADTVTRLNSLKVGRVEYCLIVNPSCVCLPPAVVVSVLRVWMKCLVIVWYHRFDWFHLVWNEILKHSVIWIFKIYWPDMTTPIAWSSFQPAHGNKLSVSVRYHKQQSELWSVFLTYFEDLSPIGNRLHYHDVMSAKTLS